MGDDAVVAPVACKLTLGFIVWSRRLKWAIYASYSCERNGSCELHLGEEVFPFWFHFYPRYHRPPPSIRGWGDIHTWRAIGRYVFICDELVGYPHSSLLLSPLHNIKSYSPHMYVIICLMVISATVLWDPWCSPHKILRIITGHWDTLWRQSVHWTDIN